MEQLAPPSPTLDHDDIEMAGDPNLGGVHSPEDTNPSSSSTEPRPKQLPAAAADKRGAADWYDDQLEQNWKRTKTTGKGAEVLKKIANLFTETEDQRIERVGFLQVRLGAPRQKIKTAKVQRKKDGDKNLRFSQCSPEIQAGLRKSRQAEWQKWQKFHAGVIFSKEEVDALVADGITMQPMQWVETDKNAHKRR